MMCYQVDAYWFIVLGELIDSSIFYPLRLVARFAYVSCIS